MGIFLAVSIKTARIFKGDEQNAPKKLDDLLKRSQIPFYLFTAILLYKLIY